MAKKLIETKEKDLIEMLQKKREELRVLTSNINASGKDVKKRSGLRKEIARILTTLRTRVS